jgi:hypothetical protein
MAQERRIVRNADNKDAMPWGNESFVVGHVDEVNGRGAEELAGFFPTRHELLVLTKYWYRRQLADRWFFFQFGSTGSTEMRVETFAWNRIHRVAEILGDDEARRAIADVDLEFSNEVDPEMWNIFLHGDAAQRAAVREKNQQMADEFGREMRNAEQKINQALGGGTEAATNMIGFLHHYPDGRSISSILRDPIDSKAIATDKQLAEQLLQILRGED